MVCCTKVDGKHRLLSSDISCYRKHKQAVVTRNMRAMYCPRMPGASMLGCRGLGWLQESVSLTDTTYASEILTCSLARTAASNSAGFSGLAIDRASLVLMLILEVDNVLRLDAHSRPVHSNSRLERGASISPYRWKLVGYVRSSTVLAS